MYERFVFVIVAIPEAILGNIARCPVYARSPIVSHLSHRAVQELFSVRSYLDLGSADNSTS